MKKPVNQKILQLRKKEKPIEYSDTLVTQAGDVKKRSSLLDERVVEGYALIWGSVNSHGESFVKGCCTKSIKEMGPGSNSSYEIKFRDEHGRVCALFEILKEDDIGLYFKTVPLDDVSWADNMLVQLRSGSINNFSIGFNHVWDKVEYDDAADCLICLEIKFLELSAVAIPSDMATYAIRSLEQQDEVQEDVNEFIYLLPKAKQLEAKKLFTRCFSLVETEQLKSSAIALRTQQAEKKPTTDLYKSLLNKLKNE